MRPELNEACTRFIENRDAFREAAKWDNRMLYPVCAGVLQTKKRRVSAE